MLEKLEKLGIKGTVLKLIENEQKKTKDSFYKATHTKIFVFILFNR